ncbi:MAG TPA: type IV toxin-antitoxin system AbiEi family antitoxin [Terriglobia bacterium]|nr:type IV toxin-antitoxin system AbiEi family antitoxin [Terriglobia bacterium]
MNSPRLAGFALEQALASKLRELLGGIPWLHDWQVEQVGKAGAKFDLIAKLTVPRETVTFYIECKGEMRPSAFHSLTERWLPPSKHGEVAVPVLAMPFVSPRLADLCVQHGWSWYDLAGNCHLEAPGAIYLERTGLPPVHRQPRPKANLSTREAARVIRALLAPQNASMRWTQRQMEVHFGELNKPRIPEPSLGLVNKVVQQLRDEAFIEALDHGGFRLRDPIKLLFAWRDAYRFNRHERRDYFTLLRGMSLREALYKLELHAGGFAAYAAFSAAEFQAPHVRQSKTWIYVRQDYLTRLEELTEAKPVDSGENVVALIPDDDGVFYPDDDDAYVGDDRMSCTNPVQTYVDLFHCGGRGLEAAEAILEQRLKPKWSGATLL